MSRARRAVTEDRPPLPVPLVESGQGASGKPRRGGPRKLLNGWPVVRGDPAPAPLQRPVFLDAQRLSQDGGATQDVDNLAEIHSADKCQNDIERKGTNPLRRGAFRRLNIPGKPSTEEIEESRKFLEDVGTRVLWLRQATGLAQKQICKLVGMEQSQWARWESGRRTPGFYSIAVVCSRFQVSMDYFIRGDLLGVHPDLARWLVINHPELLDRKPYFASAFGPPYSWHSLDTETPAQAPQA